jgi:hypothetical protein
MILLTAYLIGYFLSFGLIAGTEDKFNWETFRACFFISLLSWIMIGIFLADFIPKKEKIEP